MRMPHRAKSQPLLLAFTLVLGCGGTAPPAPSPKGQASQSAPAKSPPAEWPAPSEFAEIDYLAIGPKTLVSALEPLLAHRAEKGHRIARLYLEDIHLELAHPESQSQKILEKIHQIATRAPRLQFIVLAGDPLGRGEYPYDFAPLPTFYLPKVAYENHRPDEHLHPRMYAHDEHDHAGIHTGEVYATDLPYAYARRAPGQTGEAEPLHIGRIPGRTPGEMHAYAKKVIAYENSPAEGNWRRRIELFSGPANFGAVADFIIENTTTTALDQEVPYDYDIRVLFPKIDSPYAYPFPALRRRIVSDLNEGALIAAYVGHGSPSSFDDLHYRRHFYEIGTVDDMSSLDIPQGPPFFISITCSTGAFDLYGGRKSIAEQMVLNPSGPIAAFAASRESHPYSNALYGLAFVDHFLKTRAKTLGEGITSVKKDMKEGEIPIAPILFGSDPQALNNEHEGLYNLFGDPAIRLRYAAPLQISLSPQANSIALNSEIGITVSSAAVASGNALITLETRRSKISGKLIPQDEMRTLEDEALWDAMRKNYEVASNKVLTRVEKPSFQGSVSVRLKAPAEPGDYVIKAFLNGGGEAAAGHIQIRVIANQ